MKIIWAEPAAQDLENIGIYIFQDNPKAAIETVLRILELVETLLVENPAIGRAGRVFGTRELVLSNLPYILVYQVHDNTIGILRVLHTSRQWPE